MKSRALYLAAVVIPVSLVAAVALHFYFKEEAEPRTIYVPDIFLTDSDNNILTNNAASRNIAYAICLVRSHNNTIYNNYFNDYRDVKGDGNNTWNTTRTAGMNIIGGPYLGGNYWSDYAGIDTDGDGLGDTLLPHNGDYLPLVPLNLTGETTEEEGGE